jgi:NhaP-type Na+/H+ or K+/H+ antiporter
MNASATFLITLGALLLMGLATDAVGRLTRLPRVTLLLLFGVSVGPEAFDLLPRVENRWFSVTAHSALVMVGFLRGERFTLATLREHGRHVVWISVTAVLVTAALVSLALLAVGAPLALALLLGAVSTSTDPAATVDVAEADGDDTPFARVLLGVVAVDDAWGLVLFGLVASAVAMLADGISPAATLLEGLREVGGAALLGGVLGVPLAFLTGRVREGEPTLLEALGVVFLCGGLAIWLGGVLSRAPAAMRRFMGPALMPQAGVALGLALIAAERFPELGPSLLTIAIGTTVVFELLGPLCTRWALRGAARRA